MLNQTPVYSLWELGVLVFVYSFLAWTAETAVITVREGKFRNRGYATGPFCFIYGITAAVLALTMQELRGNPLFLLLGCGIYATAAEWLTGRTLERAHRKKWWDYSNKPLNLGGYVCLQYSLLWAVLGALTVDFSNDWIVNGYRLLPEGLRRVLIICLLVYSVIDFAGTAAGMHGAVQHASALLRWNAALEQGTRELGERYSGWVQGRVQRAYAITEDRKEEMERRGRTFSRLLWLFIIGSFLGDITETVFCRLKAGVWMSRSSLVWGPFSVIWGMALVLSTVVFAKEKDKPDSRLFVMGFLSGGAYEYLCSVMGELVFGVVFWDYSSIPFNLGGRINLLYCFFWGIAAVVWVKALLPWVDKGLDYLLAHTGRILTLIAALLMSADLIVSGLALVRSDERSRGVEAENAVAVWLDENFDDTKMAEIYPCAKQQLGTENKYG